MRSIATTALVETMKSHPTHHRGIPLICDPTLRGITGHWRTVKPFDGMPIETATFGAMVRFLDRMITELYQKARESTGIRESIAQVAETMGTTPAEIARALGFDAKYAVNPLKGDTK